MFHLAHEEIYCRRYFSAGESGATFARDHRKSRVGPRYLPRAVVPRLWTGAGTIGEGTGGSRAVPRGMREL